MYGDEEELQKQMANMALGIFVNLQSYNFIVNVLLNQEKDDDLQK